MDSRFRGNDGGEAGIRRRKSDGGGRREFHKKRREHGNLSVKMDSRFRGNDGGEAQILREKLILEFPQNDRKKPRHSRESGNPFGAINFGISAK